MPLPSLIGGDVSDNPLISDFRKFGNRLIQTFHDQPLVARALAPVVDPLEYDGRGEFETPTWEDIDDADYAMVPGETNTELVGDSVITKTPQIYKSARRTKDQWAKMFANKARLPIILTRLRQKVKIKEDYITFRGDSEIGVNGLKDGGTDLGNPSGLWGVDTGSNGILDNAQADIDAIIDFFDDNGFGGRPIDLVMTNKLYNLLKNHVMPNRNSTNLTIALEKLDGGVIMKSNNIYAHTATDHIIFGLVRLPPDESGWSLLSSEVEQEVYRAGLYDWIYGVREKFSIQIVDPLTITWKDAVNPNAS
jgi:hypothetical protein